MQFDRRFLSATLPNAEIIGDIFPEYPSVTVDSRKVRLGDIFVAIKGARHDGHELRIGFRRRHLEIMLVRNFENRYDRLDQFFVYFRVNGLTHGES